MSRITCETTTEDWVQATCHSPQHCMFARAIQRATGDPNWIVKGDSIEYQNPNTGRFSRYRHTPDWFREIAKEFDEYAQGKTLPTSLLVELVRFEFQTNTGQIFEKQSLGRVELQEIRNERIRSGKDQGMIFSMDSEKCEQAIDLSHQILEEENLEDFIRSTRRKDL